MAVSLAGPATVTARAPDVEPGSARPREIAPGVTYRRVRERGPVVMHIVRVDPGEASTVDVAAAGRRMGSFARPSVIARAHGALVAINGDFGLLRGMPLHAFQVDGASMGRGIQAGIGFAMSQDESSSFIDPGRLEIEGRHPESGATFPVHGWNSVPPEPHGLAGFTPYGGVIRRPPMRGCAVRLVRADRLAWAPLGVGITRTFEVERYRCGERRMRVDPATVVLASRSWGRGSDVLQAMTPGDRVRLTWSFGWPYVADVIGGVPRLVDDGTAIPSRCGASLCRRHPRTGIGVTGDGSLLFVVVDGRSRRSVGMTLARFAKTFVRLGAVDAVNLDGGGSSTMWIAGRGVVNRPSDLGGERAVVNAVLLLPGADAGGWPAATGRIDSNGRGLAAALDAGSTGGLAEAWIDGAIGHGPAPRAIERIAERFARSR